jgi:hypothetical protein
LLEAQGTQGIALPPAGEVLDYPLIVGT